MKKSLLSLFTALLLLAQGAHSSTVADANNTTIQIGGNQVATGAATYALTSALTGTTSSSIDLGAVAGMYFSVSATGSASNVYLQSSNDNATWTTPYNFPSGRDYWYAKRGRYARFLNSAQSAPSGIMSVWYYLPSGMPVLTSPSSTAQPVTGTVLSNQGSACVGCTPWPASDSLTATILSAISGTANSAYSQDTTNLNVLKGISGSVSTAANQTTIIGILAGATSTAAPIFTKPTSGFTWTVSWAGSPAGTSADPFFETSAAGAIATSALQTSGNSTLTTINTALQGVTVAASFASGLPLSGLYQGGAGNAGTFSNLTGTPSYSAIYGASDTGSTGFQSLVFHNTNGTSATNLRRLNVNSAAANYDGTAYDQVRMPTGNGTGIQKSTAVVNAAATTLWTPAAGNKFRVQRIRIWIPDTATCATPAELMTFYDNATTITAVPMTVNTVAITSAQGAAQLDVDLGNGYTSAVSNTALTCTLTTNLATSAPSAVYVMPIGVEGVTP